MTSTQSTALAALLEEAETGMTNSQRWAWVRGLYEAHREGLARFLVELGSEPSTVDDLVSETFIRAFEVAAHYELRSSESTWLFGIALNVARNQRAKEQRHRFLRRLFLRPERAGPGTSAEVEARSQLSAVLRAVRALPPVLREAYVVRVLEQQPLKEAAALLSVPISTVAERAARAEALVFAAIAKEEA
ncbi:MAG: RNA polymerase sigma factor [Archangium sp.]|nr:RNA polymerase sigma factor [Archangium sp.]